MKQDPAPESAAMNVGIPDEPSARLRFDGACHGNPGQAGYGVVLEFDGREITDHGSIGRATNMQAEYRGLISALELAREHKVKDLLVQGDSEVVIKQMNGEYNVNDRELERLHYRAIELADQFKMIEFEWLSRDQNERADELAQKGCNSGE